MPKASKISVIAPTLLADYRAQLQPHGPWQPDATQAMAATRLHHLLQALQSPLPQPPKGLWLYGPPGRGKSRLLGLFLQHLHFIPHRRVHFHAFMEELHRRLHHLPSGAAGQGPFHNHRADPLAHLADEIAAEAMVLGFDEFYITNIADAMMLGRLMKLLFERGVVVVATSNWSLPDLFQGGLNRDRFTPFLRLMEHHLEPIDLSAGPDYRRPGLVLNQRSLPPHYIVTPAGESAEAHLHTLFIEYAVGPTPPLLKGWNDANEPGGAFKRQQGRAVWLTFQSACDVPRSRSDYSRLATHFDTIVIEGVPFLQPEDADASIRFSTLVDILYEHNRRLIISAAAHPEDLCPAGDAAQVFQRTASRLLEMTQLNNHLA